MPLNLIEQVMYLAILPPLTIHGCYTTTMSNTKSTAPAPATAPDSQALSSPPPQWALHDAYTKPLPPSLQFDPQAGFTALYEWIRAQAAQMDANDDRFQVCTEVIAYPNSAVKNSWVDALHDSDTAREAYRCCATLSAGRRAWKQKGTIGLVVSCMDNAKELSENMAERETAWHLVAVAWQGDTVWVHDSAYYYPDHAGSVNRIDSIRGTRMVYLLLQEWKSVKYIWVQGPEPEHRAQLEDQLECMGRSAKWIEATISGTLPWPPDADTRGGRWKQYNRN